MLLTGREVGTGEVRWALRDGPSKRVVRCSDGFTGSCKGVVGDPFWVEQNGPSFPEKGLDWKRTK